ncbi:type Iii polyketide Synthase [Mycena rebaudengoi]|nr:type Iii polyketide Synthase [Mycena rebaudengoi]
MSARPALKITGMGVAYPPNLLTSGELEKTAYELYKHSPALDKTMAINRNSGIRTRSVAVPLNSPVFNQTAIPTIKTISEIYSKEGVALAVSAARLAIEEAGINPNEITHVVSTTCTNSSNPGYDAFLARELGLKPTVERVLLHGIGCTGGLAAIRLASSLCHSAAWKGRPANVLVVACETPSTLWRNELESADRDQDVRPGVAVFADGAGALVISLDYGNISGADSTASSGKKSSEKGIFEVVAATHILVPGTEGVLSFNIGPQGWQEKMSPRFFELIGPVVASLYKNLLATVPEGVLPMLPSSQSDFDWPVTTGGTVFLRSVQKAMGIEKENMEASWEVYENHGNTSSSSVLCVLETSRRIQKREWCISVCLGPGLCSEALLLRRIQRNT